MKVTLKNRDVSINVEADRILFNEITDKKCYQKATLPVIAICTILFGIAAGLFAIFDMPEFAIFLGIFAVGIAITAVLTAFIVSNNYLVTDKEIFLFARGKGYGSHTFDEVTKIILHKKRKYITVCAVDKPIRLNFYVGEKFDALAEIMAAKIPGDKIKGTK